MTELTDINGNVAKAYAYDAYGNMLESPGAVEQSYSYTGREFDSESGLMYYRSRYYDPRMGRFLSIDPIGLRGGLNLYRYVNNRPVTERDSTGLAPELEPYGVGRGEKKISSMIGGPAGTIICQGGNPEVWINDYFKDNQSVECGLTECLWRHEGVHLQDALGRNPLVCSGMKKRENGVQIEFGQKLRRESEIRAYLEEKLCLEETLATKRGNCPCKSILEGRLQRVRTVFLDQ